LETLKYINIRVGYVIYLKLNVTSACTLILISLVKSIPVNTESNLFHKTPFCICASHEPSFFFVPPPPQRSSLQWQDKQEVTHISIDFFQDTETHITVQTASCYTSRRKIFV
jgi:hypothetical protein